MGKLVFLSKAHVRAYDRKGPQGQTVHVEEHEDKRQARQWTPSDVFAGLRAHAEGLRQAVEAATAPREQKPTVARTDSHATPSRPQFVRKTPPPPQPQAQKAPQEVKPPLSYVSAMQRLENGAKLNDVVLEFAKSPIAQQSLVDKWLVLQQHPLASHAGSSAERFRLLLQDTADKLKAQKAKKQPPDIATPAPAAVVDTRAQQREEETQHFIDALSRYSAGAKFTIPVASDRKMVGTWQKVTIAGEEFWKKGSVYKHAKDFLRFKDSVLKQLEEAPAEKPKKASKIVLGAQRESKATAQQEPQHVASTFAPARTGKTETVRTDQGAKIDVQYAVVESGEPVASHDTAFALNPAFLQELQPRDRSRAASETQIQGILANFQPELLGANPKAADGAPIVGPDGAVEVGNGRTIALRRAYEGKMEQAEQYKQWLQEHAEEFGLSKDQVSGLKQPMLVRIRKTDVDRKEFVQETNKPSAAVYSPVEQAKNDARLLTPDLMSLFNPEPDSGIHAAENRSFVRGFMQGLTKEEAGGLVNSKGELSPAGATRLKNALLHRAYGNSDLVEKIAESTDDATRNVSNALVATAPRMASLKAAIESGDAHPVDLSQDIVTAALKFSNLKQIGGNVETYLAQLDLMTPELSSEGREILAVIDRHNKKPQNLRAFLHGYVDFIERAGNPKERSLFGTPATPTKMEALQYALQQAEKEKGMLAASWSGIKLYFRKAFRK